MSSGSEKSLTIKNWSEEDRPREKLLNKGRENLTDAELIAILLGSGFKEKTAVDVAKMLLQEVGNDLDKLGKLTVKQLSRTKGIGPVKAITIVAALELGRRRKYTEKAERKKVTCSRDAYDYLYHHLADVEHEECYALLMNTSNTIIKHIKVSQGGIGKTVIDARIIFKAAIEELATGIILSHNHPSGNAQPSSSDIDETKKLKQAGELMGIRLLDHLIFTNDTYYSFADEGLL